MFTSVDALLLILVPEMAISLKRVKRTSGTQVELKTSAKTPAPHPEVRSPAVNKEAPCGARNDVEAA